MLKTSNPKDRLAVSKAPLWLVPVAAAANCALALLDGMIKYGLTNWRQESVAASVYVGAAQRHIGKWFDCREDFDKDSGIHHLGHAMACIAIVLDAEAQDCLVDDRPTASKFDIDAFAEQVKALQERRGVLEPPTPTLAEDPDADLAAAKKTFDDYLKANPPST